MSSGHLSSKIFESIVSLHLKIDELCNEIVEELIVQLRVLGPSVVFSRFGDTCSSHVASPDFPRQRRRNKRANSGRCLLYIGYRTFSRCIYRRLLLFWQKYDKGMKLFDINFGYIDRYTMQIQKWNLNYVFYVKYK